MKQAALVLFLIIGILSVRAQVPTREQLVGTWIGIRIEYDQHLDRPYPVYLKLGADSTYVLGLIDEKSPNREATWDITNQKIRLDTSIYALGQWTLRDNELRLRGAFPTLFRRLTDIVIDSAATGPLITGYSWLSDSLTYHFHADGLTCIEDIKTGDIAVHCWRLAQVDHSVFLVIKGKVNDCEGNFQYPIQLTQVQPDKLTCLVGNQKVALTLRRGAALKMEQPCQPKGFQPCNTYVFSSFNLYPYFSYKRGRLYDIRQIVDREYKPVNLPGQSGLVRFRFIVNCRGEAGRFEMLTVDENYQKCTFDPLITNQLLTICHTKLTDWEAGKTNDNQTSVDTFCLLTFRLKDGLITDIFP